MEQFKKIGTMVAAILVTVASVWFLFDNLIGLFDVFANSDAYVFFGQSMFGAIMSRLLGMCFYAGTGIFGALKCIEIFIDKK